MAASHELFMERTGPAGASPTRRGRSREQPIGVGLDVDLHDELARHGVEQLLEQHRRLARRRAASVQQASGAATPRR